MDPNVVCTRHGAPCMLKTGSKQGPNYGKSFYICSVLRDKCDFAQAANSVPTSNCLKHPENMADLQYVAEGKVSGEKRHYYRCRQRVDTGSNWCGYTVVGTVPRFDPLRDSQLQNIDESVIITSVSVKKAVGDAENQPTGSTLKGPSVSRGISQLNRNVFCESQGKASSKPTCASNSLQNGTEKSSSARVFLQASEANSTVLAGSHQAVPLADVITILDDTDANVKISLADTPPLAVANSTVLSEDSNDAISAPKNVTSTLHIDLTKTAPVTSLYSKSQQSHGHSAAATNASKQHINISKGQQGSGDNYRSELSMEINQARRDKLSRELKQKKHVLGTVNLNTLPDKGKRIQEQVEELQRELSYLNLQLVNNPHLSQKSAPETATSSSHVNLKTSAPPPPPPPPPPPLGSTSTSIPPAPPFVIGKSNSMSSYAPTAQKSYSSSSVQMVSKASSASAVGQAHRQPQVYTVYPTNPSGNRSGSQPKTVHVMHKPSGNAGQKDGIFQQRLPGTQATKQTVLSFKSATEAQGQKQMIVLDKAEPLPDHVLRQMYSDNPQLMSLYGGRMTADRLKQVGTVTRDAIEDLHKQLERRPLETEEVEDPRGLNVTLMTHQRQALTWLIWREKQLPSGGILADDMGLGKTLTMISLVMKQRELNGVEKPAKAASAKGRKSGDWTSKDKQLEKLDKNIVKSRATLVICPASLIHQWQKEIERRCQPGILEKVLLYHGPNREPNVNKLADNDIVLTTYNIVSKEVASDADVKEAEKPVADQKIKKAMPNLSRIAWERLILDEAHNIKNHKCKTSIAVCRLRAGSRWALTGTPIQNDLLDMYSLLRFLRCSPFDEFQVWKRQVASNAGTGKVRLNTLVKTFLLRRTKDQKGKGGQPLVPLPTKSIVLHELHLSKEEKSVYDKVYAQSQSKFKDYLKRHAEKHGENLSFDNDMGSHGGKNPFMDRSAPAATGGGRSGQKNTGGTHILVSLLRLRQCCGHLSLLKEAIEDDVLETEGIELTLEEQMRGLLLNDDDKPSKKEKSGSKAEQFDKTKASTKIEAVMDGLQDVQRKSSKSDPIKSVVVSQWTRMLEIVAHHLEKVGIRCNVIQGNIPPHKRMEIVDDFNTNPSGAEVLLLSLRAGGVGLNLIGGSNLFLLDQHWNPALEEQAFDRIYRVGQKKDVVIHKFLCTDTVEEKIAELQKRKTDLANDILTGTGGNKRKLTLADLRLIFGV